MAVLQPDFSSKSLVQVRHFPSPPCYSEARSPLENLDANERGSRSDPRSDMLWSRDHWLQLPRRHRRPGAKSRRTRLCVVLDVSRDRCRSVRHSGRLDRKDTQGQRRCLSPISKADPRRHEDGQVSLLLPPCHESLAQVCTGSWSCRQVSIVREEDIGTLDRHLGSDPGFPRWLRSDEIRITAYGNCGSRSRGPPHGTPSHLPGSSRPK